MTVMRELRRLRISGAVGALRVEQFESRDHLVVPVTMLVGDEVIFASNASGPELVPASEVERSAHEWNGRPVVGDHPQRDGAPCSANDPDVYMRECFGRVVAPRFANGRLEAEAWLDPQRAAQVGPDAVSVCERATSGQPVEISVGAYVTVEARNGVAVTASGDKEYRGVWRDIGSDHLAMLPEGVLGACSNEMGCGVRSARRHLLTAQGLAVAGEPEGAVLTEAPRNQRDSAGKPAEKEESMPSKKDTAWERLARRLFGEVPTATAWSPMEVAQLLGAQSVSDSELRDMLTRAIYGEEPGFQWIQDVFPSDGFVIYATAPEGELLLWKRKFSMTDGDAGVSLAARKQQVKAELSYQVVAAEGEATDEPKQPAQAASGCQCQHENPSAASAKEEAMSKIAERVKALIANPKSPFKEADEPMLAALSEEAIKALEDAHAPTAPKVEPAVPTPTATTPAPGMVQLPEAEVAMLRRAAERMAAEDAKRKAEIVARLKTAQTLYTEAQLAAMDVDNLDRIVALLDAHVVAKSEPNYTAARGLVDNSLPPLPDPWGLNKQQKGVN